MKNNTKQAINKQVNDLMKMASDDKLNIESLLIEEAELDVQIQALELEIVNITPNEADYNEAKSPYQVSLAARQAELNRHQTHLEEINGHLESENEKLQKVMAEIQEITNEKPNLDGFVRVLENYKKRREFKTYAEDNEALASQSAQKLEEAQNRKTHIRNSIDLLVEEKNDVEKNIASCEEEAQRLELLLASNKELENSSILKEKQARLTILQEKLQKLIDRKQEINNSPEYIAHEINELMNLGSSYTQIKEKVLKLYEMVRSKPYMSTVIRNGDTNALKEKYAALSQNYKDLKTKIAKSDYILKNIPAEDNRLSDLEKLINSKNKQIATLKELIAFNDNAILILLRHHRDLQSSYNQEIEQSENYLKQSESLDNITKITMKADYTRHQKVLAEQKEIITAYPNDVQNILNTNKELNEMIASCEKEIKAYKDEMRTILSRKKHRKPIKNYIERAAHEKELAELQSELNYLNKRISFADAKIEPINTKNEILDGLKVLYADEIKQEKEKEKKAKAVASKPSLEEQTIEITPMNEPVSKEEVKEEVNSFAAIGDLLDKLDLVPNQPELAQPEDIDLRFNIDETIKDIESKKGETESVVEVPKPEPVLENALDLNELSKEVAPQEELVQPTEPVEPLVTSTPTNTEISNEKIKVISVEPYIQRMKVVKVEPLEKQVENAKTDEQVYNGIAFISPFSEQEPALVKAM